MIGEDLRTWFDKSVLLESLHSAFRFGPSARQNPGSKLSVSDPETGFKELGRIHPVSRHTGCDPESKRMNFSPGPDPDFSALT
jgi:hypothetical protein